MWVSRSEFETLKAKVACLEDAAYVNLYDSVFERTVKTSASRLIRELLYVLGARADVKCSGERVTITLSLQGISRYSSASRTPQVFSHSEVLELLLKHLEVDLVKTPATPETSTLVPRKQSVNNES